MIPKVSHSRSQLLCNINEYDTGARTFFVSADTYPELFDILCAEISKKSPTGWKTSSGGKMKYLWFPPEKLDDEDIEVIEDWREKFEHYVLLGLNRYIESHFSEELDFCMALDFNYSPEAQSRTIYGEAEYRLKYRQSRSNFKVLEAALEDAIDDLPIPPEYEKLICVTSVPSDPNKCNVAKKLAKAVAGAKGYEYIEAELLCDKGALKELPVQDKIAEWEKLYGCIECVQLKGDVEDSLIVIIDDLYQSGATMWTYARYLKLQGAEYVMGLPCVKSLRDSDNK